MDISLWEARYRSREQAKEDFDSAPAQLVIEMTNGVKPGKALDLACGTGQNALWLAEQGWQVTAVDGSPTAIDVLRRRAAERKVSVEAVVADLESHQYSIQPLYWDLIVISYYLQRDLLGLAMAGLVPGGLFLAIVHIAEQGEEPTKTRLMPGELAKYFSDWGIVYGYEGKPPDSNHQRSVAEIAARRPGRAIR